VAGALGVARMGEQGHYRPPRWRSGGEVPLEALEAAFGAAPEGVSNGGKPSGNGAHATGPETSTRAAQPETGTRTTVPDAGPHTTEPNAGPRSAEPGTSAREPGTDRTGQSWPAVAATTMRLWLRRRKGTLGAMFRHRWAIALAVLAAAALVVSALTLVFPRYASTAPGAGQDPTAAAAGQAAAWVAHQISRDAVVGCDPGMCRALQARGFPAASLLTLRPGAADLRLCDVIVATQAVRMMMGSGAEQQDAPTVLAGFGSGTARTDVRAVAPHGAAAYLAALAADWAARRMAAAQLLGSPRIHATGAVRAELLSGRVDSRLLITLAALSVSQPVKVVAFGGAAPDAAAGVPLREMEVSPAGSPAPAAAGLGRIRSMVLAQHAVFLPSQVALVRLAGGGAALRIEFGAPSPLGLLIGRPVTQ
jgi:hypothetical protein